MKNIFILTFFILNLSICFSQNNEVVYDSTLAKQLGADDYGMKTYVFVILKTGENTIEDKVVRDSLFRGHMENINRLVDEGILIVAGPFYTNENNFRGLFILAVASIDEAEEILQTDPAIKENLLKPECYLWYGSAALPLYLEDAEKISKTKP